MFDLQTQKYVDLLNALSVGFDELFNSDSFVSGSNYPPHNCIKCDDNLYRLEFAVAGFTDKDIEVSVEDGKLIVSGLKQDNNSDDKKQYLHKGIATRSFKKVFKLSKDIEVKNATLVNGILTVELESIIPEHKKRKLIELKTE